MTTRHIHVERLAQPRPPASGRFPATSAGSSRTSWCSTSRSAPVRSGLSAGGRWIRNFGSWSRDRQTVMGGGLLSKRERICRGTEGSNPVSSSMESPANLLPFISAPDPLPAPKLPVTDRLRSNPPASVPPGSCLEDCAASSKRPDAARLSLRIDRAHGRAVRPVLCA